MGQPTTEEAAEFFDFYDSIEVLESDFPQKLASLRQKLRGKASREKRFRFYSLYAHVHRRETLEAAWKLVKANNGAPGVDGESIREIERREGGIGVFLAEIEQSLREKTYNAEAVLRVYILKENGGERPLGIPTVRDRVVQMAVKLIIEPIFEVDFEDCSYGFRPGRSAHDALSVIRGTLKQGFCAVYDVDLKGYFDSIPHDKLLACVRMRIVDGGVLKLIRMWLRAPVVDRPKDGGAPTIKRNRTGTPQGGVISPLLANAYLHWFDKLFHRKDGPRQWANARLVRYADDFVVLARYIGPELQQWIEGKIEDWMGLQINREKTRTTDLRSRSETLDFLGYSFRLDRSRFGRSRYWNQFPSKKSLQRERNRLREMTGKRQCFKPASALIAELNTHLRGWAVYYGHGYPRQAMQQINACTRERLRRHLKRRSQRGYRRPQGKSWYAHIKDLGLIYL